MGISDTWYKIKRTAAADPIPCFIFGAVLMGIAIGFIIRAQNPNAYTVYMISIPGELMIRSLEGLVLPLIVFSVMSAIITCLGVHEDSEGSDESNQISGEGRNGGFGIGWRAMCYYLFTTTISIIIGVTLTLVIHPGDPLAKPPSFGFEASEDEMIDSGSSIDVLLDVFRNLIPNNIIGAAMWQDKTQITRKNVTRSTADNQTITVVEEKRDLRRIQGANILGLIFYAALVAMALRKMSNTGRILIRIIFGLNELIMNILYLFMWFVPLGVCSLVASTISEVQDVMRTASMIGSYTLTVLIGLALQFQVYIILYLLICRKNPATFFFKQARANMISFGTSSTAAALPANMQCAIENNKINRQVVKFMLPIGAAINCDGIPVYEAVATMFVAQMHEDVGMVLNAPTIINIVLTVLAASIGAANVTNTGLVTMVIVFKSVGLPLEAIGWLFTFDWLLDRCRTVLTMSGDAYGAAIVSKLCNFPEESSESSVNDEFIINLKETLSTSMQLNSGMIDI